MISKILKLSKNNTNKEILFKITKFILNKSKLSLKNILSFFLSIIDRFISKKDSYWIFPVYFIGRGHLSDNMLAVFEIVKNDENIKKIILTKDIDISIDGKNIEIVPMNSIKAIYLLMKSNVIFVQHSVWLDLSQALFQIIYPLNRKIINLWHGIPMKDISHQNTGIINNRAKKEMKNYFVITSSKTDDINMKKAFSLTSELNFWITGLPRNDFLKMPKENLPKIYKEELEFLDKKLNGQTLILYAPTYREVNSGGSHYEFSNEELDILEKYLLANNLILGVRYHSYLQPSDYSNILNRSNILDLSSNVISDVRMIIRKSKLIITDYSSLFIDAMYIDKKCVSFAYDLEHYKKTQRGFFYEFEEIFPGKICENFHELIVELDNINEPLSSFEKERLKTSKEIFFKYNDTSNSKRVVDNVKKILE